MFMEGIDHEPELHIRAIVVHPRTYISSAMIISDTTYSEIHQES